MASRPIVIDAGGRAEDWEEVVMVVDVPSGVKLNAVNEEDLYFQALGLWSEEPVVKLDNMVYTGEIDSPIGSSLLVEVRDGDEKASKSLNSEDRTVLVANKCLKLHPVDVTKKEEFVDDKEET